MHYLLGLLLTPVFYLVFGFLLGIFHPIQWISLKMGGYKSHKKSVDVLNFFLTYSQIFLLNWAKLKKKINIPTDRPILFVSNHQSAFDIPGLIFFFRRHHGKFVSKVELLKANIPSISFNLKYGGAANIDRKNPEGSKREIAKLADNMKTKNWSAFIFPEGTRTKDGKMKEFKVGGIETFIHLVPNLLIVPVAITGNYEISGRRSFPLDPLHRATWEVLNPIEPKGKDILSVVKAAENAIKERVSR